MVHGWIGRHLSRGGHAIVITRGFALAGLLLFCTAACLGFGIPLYVTLKHQVQHRQLRYDDIAASSIQPSSNTSSNTVQLTFTVDKTFEPPVYAYYRLPSYYQNHKRYVRSVSWPQMAGDTNPNDSLSKCDPRRYVGNGHNASLPDGGSINPCGLLPGSLFNDTLTSITQDCGNGATQPIPFDTSSITWHSNYLHDLYGSGANATNFNTIPSQRLGGSINGTVGSNPQLIVWTQPDAWPGVIKTWAVIHQPLSQGCQVTVSIVSLYNVTGWGGEKQLVLASHSWAGSNTNLFLPIMLIVLGSVLGFAAPVFLLAGLVASRRNKWLLHVD